LLASGPMATALSDLKLHGSGKVREIYEDGDDLVMVASDRISVYDVILPTPIPDKGKVLTQMSLFWFELTGDIVPSHFISEDVPPEAVGRGMRVRKLDMYPVECVVRGYITGSGWKEYQQTGEVCGIELPSGLSESDKLPEPIFTPATKAELGEHDENIDFDRAAESLARWGLDLRVFVLFGVPYLEAAAQSEWCLRSIEHARRAGARAVTILPVRRTGELAALERRGEWSAPQRSAVEATFEAGLALAGECVLQVDLWDADRWLECERCAERRSRRLAEMNRVGRVVAAVDCVACGR